MMNRLEFFNTLKQTNSGREYKQLIENVNFRNLEKESGFEFHHIFPKALGGTDEDGIVKLSCFEHIKVHILLAQSIPCRETLGAVATMFRTRWMKLSDVEQLTLEQIQNAASIREQIQDYCKQLRIEQCLKPENREKAKQTRIERYGSVNATLVTPEAREKAQNTLKKKYGSVTGAMNTPEAREKSKKARNVTYEHKRGLIQTQEFQNWYKNSIKQYNRINQAVPDFLMEVGKKLTDYPRVPSPGPYVRKGTPRGAKKGQPSHNKGHKMSEESKQKMRESRKKYLQKKCVEMFQQIREKHGKKKESKSN